MTTRSSNTLLRMSNRVMAGLALTLCLPISWAASTDLGNAPLFTSSSTNVKPNLMFILDDSGSMKSDYIPDDANFATTKYGKLTSQCNGVAYNPNQIYALPVDSTGATLPAGSLTMFSLDPNKLSGQYSLATVSPSTLTFPATVGSTITATITGLGRNVTGLYASGDTVSFFSSTNTTNFIVGTVSSWTATNNRSNNSGTLVVTVVSSTGTGSLSTGLKVADNYPVSPSYFKYKGSQKALSYTYTSSGVITTTDFYKECNSNIGASPGSGVFDQISVLSTSAEAQNYANWYTYYRTRMDMAKSSIGLVFQTLDSKYRVGYTTIGDDTITESTTFLNIRDFDATQKKKFYDDLSAAVPGGYTPLRGALSKAGRYYANKISGQSYDPMQYSCQKNFTILSTDGYWNTNDETSSYGPYGLDGKNVGQLDGTNSYPTALPKYDGARTTVTKKITWNTIKTVVSQTATTTTSYANTTRTTTGTYGTGSGTITTNYSGVIANSGLSVTAGAGSCRASNCTVTVTTSSNHGFNTGDVVSIFGSNGDAAFRGSFTITWISNTSFSYTRTGFSSNSPSSPSTKGFSALQGSCTSGQGSASVSRSQVDTYPLTLTSTTTANVTQTVSYTKNSAVTTTPYTETQTIVNGAITSDNIVRGTPSTTNSALTPPANTSTTNNGQVLSGPTSSAGTSYVSSTVSLPASTQCVSSNPTSGQTSNTTVLVTTQPSYTTTNVATSVSPPNPSSATTVISDTGEVQDASSIATTSSSATSGGSTDSLADVSFYYFNNDLRDKTLWNNCTGSLGTDVCGTTDKFLKQNMVSLTLGLGASGLLAYDKNYMLQKTAGSGDFYAIKNGDKTWPIPANGSGPENIDDLWHAAVNSTDFGTAAIPVTNPATQYFSAGDPQSLVESLTVALANVKAVVGSSSAAATSTLQPVAGDNDVFVAKFTSVKWTGDIQRFSIDPTTGSISSSYTWSAAKQLDDRDLTTSPRKVFYAKSGQTTLKDFTYSNLKADGLDGYFDGFCSKAGAGANSSPAQCAFMADKTAANTGSNLIAYLKGASDNNYRARDSRMGDVINGAPLFIGIPKFKYSENGYGTFAASTRQGYCGSGTVAGSGTREGTVYVGANDGMIHAFDRCDGSEKWAYIPKTVMPNLYKIADNAYGSNHSYFVDGAPVTGDVYDGTNWRTIVVGGLNAGGRGYYALDVTDPSNPKSLWEFTSNDNKHLGYTFGNPIITKRKSDNKWVVVFGSGYNNNTNGGDGNGHLIMVDAITGSQVLDLPTLVSGSPVGSSGTPSGLAKLNAWIDAETDNTALRYYGGDLLGNVWRFDTEALVAPNNQSFRLAQLLVGSTPQPITVQPELAEVSYHGAKYAVVYVGTGSYLGMSDLSTTGTQSIYAIKDTLSSTTLGDLRASNTLVAQTLTTNGSIRTATKNSVDWVTKNGWVVDLPTSGERVNVNMVLAFNVISVASTVPSVSACESGGTSWLYKLDIANGAAVSNATDGAAGLLLKEGTLIVGQTVVQLTDGSATTISTLGDGGLRSDSQPAPPSSTQLKRTSWRELAN